MKPNVLTIGRLALLARLQTITPNQGYRTDAGTRVLSGWFNELVKERHEGFPLIVVQPGRSSRRSILMPPFASIAVSTW
ncbi:hypothetical protein P4209_31995 [Pseudomonas aeruginosa]|nr:hypothetical protein [Pseudomonas aeruginosa]